MNKPLSVYLDLLRFVAACGVFAHHLDFTIFGGVDSFLKPEENDLPALLLGHKMVVVFFVLSGYVITYVACERERTLAEFALARVVRIYSVALPAIALTICVDASLIAAGKAHLVPVYQYAGFWKYLPLSLLFLNQLWFLNENTFSNGAFWSLCYEVWYYALFAAFFYGTGRLRWLSCGVIALVMGPKILALFPLWLLGALAYKLGGRIQMGIVPARWLLAGSAMVLGALIVFDVLGGLDSRANDLSGGWINAHLGLSHWFLSDTIIGAVCAINMLAARFAQVTFGVLAAPIKMLASYTFSLYLTHGAFLPFWSWHFGLNRPALIVLVGLSVLAFGTVTEHQKDHLKRWLGHRLAMTQA